MSHYRLCKGPVTQEHDPTQPPYRFRFFPYGPLFAFGLCLVITLGQDCQAFINGIVGWPVVIVAYIGIPASFLTWIDYRLVRGDGIVCYPNMYFPRPPALRDSLTGQDPGPELPIVASSTQ